MAPWGVLREAAHGVTQHPSSNRYERLKARTPWLAPVRSNGLNRGIRSQPHARASGLGQPPAMESMLWKPYTMSRPVGRNNAVRDATWAVRTHPG